MSFPRYSKCKDSGVEWLGEVPAHWRVSRLGYESWVRARLGWKGLKAEEYVDDGIAFLATPNIKGAQIDFDNVNYISEERYEESPEIKLNVGDVLLAKDGSTLGTVNIVRSLPRPATVNGSIAVISPYERVSGPFLYYLFQSRYMEETIQRIKGGMGVPHLFQEDLRKFHLAYPELDEQASIVDFLERETAQLGLLIEEQQRLVEVLKEKRVAVMSHAVTRGLERDVRTKPSGIGWIGDIPSHWECLAIKWVAKVESGHTPDKKVEAYWENGDIPWVSLNDTGYLRDHDYISETAFNTTRAGIDNSSARILPPNAVVFSRDATIGRCAITTRSMAVSQHFIAWICSDRILPEYLLRVCRAMEQELERLTFGATIKTIGMPDVRALATPLPPIAEQKRILDYIDEAFTRIDSLIDGAAKSVQLLQERRSALISAAVTGKIDVRNSVAECVA